MIDFLFQMGLSNACLSLALGIVAMVAGAKGRRPGLAHMLWLLVFIKLVTPPVMRIPIITIPAEGETAVAINDISRPIPPISNSHQPSIDEQPDASLWSKFGSTTWNHARVWLPPIWLLGSVVVFGWSIVRICRFSRLLAAESEVAPQQLQTEAEKIAHRLGLKTIPTICTTSASITPMVWWAGGKVRIVIPKALLDRMDAQKWKWILAHELAHVRRRDYLVRWLEWLACVFFWWNPVVWWAQRNLRAMEEICCDDLVISCLNPKPKFYADSLLTAVEFLASPALRPPAMASEINSGGFLERRFKMIVSNKSKQSNSRWLQIYVLLCAMVVLPLGIASAQDYEAVERRLGEGVAKGELTLKQAGIMLDALKKAGGYRKDQGADRAKAYLMKVKKELGELVEAGKISKEAAVRRYEGAEKGIRERLAAGRRESQRGDDKPNAYEGFERRIKAAVEAGKIAREEAGKQLEGLRRRMEMARRGERGERRITVEEYKRAEAKMRKMIEDGKAKPEDVERRLIEMRKMIGRQAERGARGERERGERRMTVEEYRSAKERMRKMVEEGKAKPEDIERRLIEMRKMIGRQREPGARSERERGERRMTVEEYRSTEAKMRKMVEEGKAKPEDIERRLIEMRRMIAAQGERGARDERERGERRITVEEYRRTEEKMRKMVEEGKAKPEDVERRLIEMRKMMAGQGERQRGGERQRTTRGDKRDEYEGLERRIKAAVEAGKMTREEAREKLEEYKKRIGR